MATNPYFDILGVQKKTPEATPVEGGFRVSPVKAENLGKNPYRNLAESTLTSRKQSFADENTRNMEASIQKDLNPGAWETVKGTVRGLPNAFGEVLTEAFTNPVTSARSVLLGGMDAGTRVINATGGNVANALSRLIGENQNYKLPLVGETFATYVGGESDTDVQKAIRTGAEQFAGYELGGGLLRVSGVRNKLAVDVLGNVIGGQATTEANTPGERAKQALFDAVFGVVENLGARGFAKASGKAYNPNVVAPGGVGTVGSDFNGGKITDIKTSDIPPPPPKTTDILENPEIIPKPTMARTAYVAKKDLGLDSRGQQIMATTEVDAKTGNAIVYYDQRLDTNPKLKEAVFDFEEPHIVSKRLGEGEGDFASALSNPKESPAMMEKVLGDFANKEGRRVDDVANDMAIEIRAISGTDKALSEQFADAYGFYKNNPVKVAEQAPTFAKFMESPVMEGRYSTSVKTSADLAKAIPEHASQIEFISSGKGTNVPKTDNIISINDKHYELVGDSKAKFLEAKSQHDTIVKNPSTSASTKKALGMQLSALKRELTGDYTATEMRNLIKKEESNYVGKEVIVKINGLEYYGNVAGKSSYGNVPITLKDGNQLKVKGSEIRDPRTKAEIVEKITFREEAQPFEAKTNVKNTDTKPPKTETKPAEKEPVTKIKKEKTNPKIAETGLDTKKRVQDKSSFRADKNIATEDIEIFMNKMDAENANFSDQRISKSNEDIKDLARMSGVTPEELMAAKPGSIANSETVTAARQMVLNKASELVNEIKGKSPETMNAADRKAIRDKFVELIAVQRTVAGFRTEASNTLRSFGIELRPGENIAIDELMGNLQKMGVASEGDMAIFASKVADQVQLTKGQKIGRGALQTWYASILSGPKTTVRNVLSTGSNILTDLVSKTANPKTWNEVIPSIRGLIKGFSDAKGEFAKDLKDIATLQAVDPSTGKFFDFDSPIKEEIFTGNWAKYGQVVESVGRFLNAQDKFLSAGAQEMEKAALRVNQPDISDAISTAISKAYGESSVYRGSPKGHRMEAAVTGLTGFLKKVPEARLIVPFVKTVGNVIDRQFDYIPLVSYLRLSKKNITQQVDRIAKDFDITSQAEKDLIGKRLRDQQIGRMNLGLALTTGAIVMASQGRISGVGPSNYNERIQLQRTGWRPNSIKVGDTWVPYMFLGPISGIFSMAGNIHDKIEYDNSDEKDLGSMLANGIVGWTQSQLNNSFLSGVSDLLDVVNGGKDAGEWLSKTVSGFAPIPAIYTQVKDIALNATANLTEDDTFKQQYQTKDITDNIRVKLGLTGKVFGMDKLQPKLDQFGDPMTSDLIFGVTPSREKGQGAEVDNFLISHDSYVTIPLKTTKYTNSDGKDVKLSPSGYNRYVKESGKQIYAALLDSIRSGDFEDMTDAEIKKEVLNISSSIRSDVRDELIP